jgi:transcription elongation factor Elf1
MKKNTNKNDLCLQALVETESILLFYQFTCPYCSVQNILSKTQKQKVVLCSQSGCRKIIILDNIEIIDEVA